MKPLLQSFLVRAFGSRCFLLLLLILPLQMAAQTISGKVSDMNNNPLAGASVMVRGDVKRATATDEKGMFTIQAAKGETIEVTMAEFETESFLLDDQVTVDFRLQGKLGTLQEVIMIGYGRTKRSEAVSSVVSIPTDNFINSPATLPAELLQGRAAGVQVARQHGEPGTNVNIIIRGSGSLTNLAPLYIIDGMRADYFNALNPADIENITILKDASATAIYGANGANGVVIITTKRPKRGKPVINASTQWGFGKRIKKIPVLKTAEYLEFVKEYLGVTTLPDYFEQQANVNTDWQDQVFRTANVSNHTINVSGGTDKVLYSFSAGYKNFESIIAGNYSFRAPNLRFSLEENLGKLKLGQILNLQYEDREGNGNANIAHALAMPPYLPVYDNSLPVGYAAPSHDDLLAGIVPNNPVATTNRFWYKGRYLFLNPQFFAELTIIPSLKIRSQLLLRFMNHHMSLLQKPYMGFFGDEREMVWWWGNETHENFRSYTLENYASWDKQFGKHRFSATLGNSYLDKGRSAQSVIEGELENELDIVENISSLYIYPHGASTGYWQNAEISYFGRLIYTLDDKYIFSASTRRDGSSVFGNKNQWGNFPGLGFAWRASKEKLLEKLTYLSDLKLRLSWGKTGNSNADPFQNLSRVYRGTPPGSLGYSLGMDEYFNGGATVNRLPNPLLRWEETTQTDVGLDIGFFKNRLNITIDWYRRTNEDLLVDIPIPNSSGSGSVNGESSMWVNAASVRNTGLELAVAYNKEVNRNLSFNFNINGAFNKNRVLDLHEEIYGDAYFDDRIATVTRIGDPIASFYGFRVDRVASSQDEIDSYNERARRLLNDPNVEYQDGALPGDFLFKDLNGDGIVTDDDQEIIGNPMPDFIFGGTAEIRYKNFDASIVISGATGLELFNAVKYVTMGSSEYGVHNISTEYNDNRWRNEGDQAKYPRAFQHTYENSRPSDFFIEDGSFARVKLLTIGYRIPPHKLKQVTRNTLSSARIYFSAENLFTVTKYTGIEPELGRMDENYIFTRGIDRANHPQPRTLVLGIQISL